MSSRWNVAFLLLHLLTLAAVGAIWLDRRSVEDEDEEPTTMEELVEEVSTARYQLRSQADRLSRLLDRLARGDIEVRAIGGGDDPAADATTVSADDTPSRILERYAEIADLHERFKWDPLQREPVEKERARLEDLLRRAGNDSIDALGAFLPTLPSLLEDAKPGWVQTRLLTHVVAQVDSVEAADFAMAVLEDPQYNSGVRLVAATAARGRYEDRVIERLIGLLERPDPSFARPEQIAQFFKGNKDDRAIPALCALAKNVDGDRTARRFALESLGVYDDPRVIDALKEVTTFDVHGDLRGVAFVSLNRLLGEDVLPFIEYLRKQWAPEDPFHQLLNNTEAVY
ncbi:MAG: hypothetical protein ACF8XB_18780, partial [Planctomycetota bacterium JB042]